MSADGEIRPAAAPDLPGILALLADAGLPTDGVSEHIGAFCVLEAGGRVAAAAGVENHGRSGLLRSVVVSPELRGRGIARSLCERLAGNARGQGIDALYLLTLDAQDCFARLGFRALERAAAPAGIRASREFRELCPDSATLMCRELR